ncbi:lactonase family protein [Streptomyces sp. ET3-23]|uniref:lactonase family protein n=1 Tax=Streptomyces sp. ET3-23 TaxID=2885643 RepID=UPI001D127D0F|nr:lactonase family protein [Streptomyces sp. ET3-23]MCC2277948.1 lactonase family protein [Streptomyces sp. ET3-23]
MGGNGHGGGQRGRWAYIGSFTEAGGHGITVAEVDPDTGALTPVHATDAVANPSFLALSPGRDVLYTVSETDDGAVAAFSLADPARPRLLGAAVPVGGAGPTHLAVAGARLFTANYGSGSVSALSLRPDGSPAAPAGVLPHHGSGPVAERQEGAHAHAVVPDPSGAWLLAADLGTDAVYVYALDPATGAPAPHRETALRPGSGPRQLAFHPRGHRAYVVGELDSTVTVCRWDAATGEFAADSPEVRTAAASPGGGSTPNHPSTAVVSEDGRFLWVANRGHDSITVFALGPDGGTPALRGTVGCGGHWPRHLAAHPGGRLLYAANERSGDVGWFAVDPDTGIPAQAGAAAVPAASCVVFA